LVELMAACSVELMVVKMVSEKAVYSAELKVEWTVELMVE